MANANLQVIDALSPIGSLDAYLQMVNRIPLLNQQEESTLATRLQQDGDLEAARQLVLGHLRFVARVAKGYLGYGLALADLIQEGNIGLMKAVKHFDVNRGVRLVSFAVHWIKAEIHEFIIRNWRIVKIATTKAQRKLFFNLRKTRKHVGWLNNDEVNQMADTLDVTARDVREMELRLNNQDTGLEEHLPDEGKGSTSLAPIAYLSDESHDPAVLLASENAETHAQKALHTALTNLDSRSQHILRERWLSEEKATLQTLASHYNISIERVRQLEKTALEKLKGCMGVF